MKKRYSQFVMLTFSLITLIFMMACGGGGREEPASSNATNSTSSELQTTTVEISIQIPDFSNARQLAATSEDVVRVTVDVTNEIGNVYVAAQELEVQGDLWVGQLENIPVGLILVLKIHAYDTNGIEIYSAETSEVFSETPQPISMVVAPVPRASASVSLRLPSSSSTARLAALSTIDDIVSVSLDILDGETTLTSVTLAESNNTWSTDPPVSELPVGVLLTFRATALDAGSTEIFKGETTTYLHSEANNIIIFMSLAADSNGTLLTFPRITQIQLPQEFAPATTGTVSISVEGSTNEELIYELGASGGGSFAVSAQSGATISGTINVGGTGETQLDTTYLAPATTNNYNNTVTMTNELGNSITWSFVTQVANPTGNISLIFNPIITGLNVSQIATSGTSLFFVATLSEDPNQNNTGLIYDWTFANTGSSSATIATSSNNTMTLGNYDPNTTQGTLTLIVTDPILVEGQQRQTTLRYQIPLQLFPEDTIDYLPINPGGISQQAYIKADNNDSNDEFGYRVSLSGDTLAVGANQEDSNQTTITAIGSTDDSNSNSGAVYIFTRSGITWSQEAYLKADNNDSNDVFGSSVSLSGDTLAVGANSEDSNQTTITTSGSSDDSNTTSGAVYVFTRSGTTWSQEAYLKADNNDDNDQFGLSVSLSGDTLAVGARYEDSNQTTITTSGSADDSSTDSGAVYVFTRSGTIWTQQAYIKADNNDSGDRFGNSISLSGDTLAVGAHREDSNQTTITTSGSVDDSSNDSGAVYVFTRSGTTWSQEAYLKADNNGSGDTFSSSVSLSGDTLAVGAASESSNQTTITTTGSVDDSNFASGAVYIFTRSGTTWTQQAYIKADNNDSNDQFSTSVSLSGDTLAVGAQEEDSNQTTITTSGSTDDSNINSGAVYLFTRSGTTWSLEAYLKADNNGSNDQFGSSVSLSSDTLAVGVNFEDSNQTTITTTGSTDNSNDGSGAVYVFDL